MKRSPNYYMSIALKQAELAFKLDEVPVGCVIVKDDKIISKGFNKRENKRLTISHAEIEAINKANKKLNSWRLNDCDIYITLEPCLMCAGAILEARFKNVYFGARDDVMGAFNLKYGLLDNLNNNSPLIHPDILSDKCEEILKTYFKNKRK